jgi:hypothetical protein
MVLTYFLNDFEMVPVAPIITGICILDPDTLTVTPYDLIPALRSNYDFKFNLTLPLRFCCLGFFFFPHLVCTLLVPVLSA